MIMVALTTAALLCISLMAIPASGCQPGWIRRKYKCYFNSLSLTLNWFDAQSYCTSMGGHIAVPVNSRENGIIEDMLRQSGKTCAWIGVSDAVKEGQFVKFPSQLMIGYSNWYRGEPNNANGEDCVMINKTIAGRWNDGPCKLEECNFTCEM